MGRRGSLNTPQHISFGDSGSVDAFSRARVSDTGQRFDVTFALNKQPLLIDEIVAGTGSATHDTNLRAVYLSTGGTASGAKAKLKSRYYVPYTPGNSQLITITGNLNPDNVAFTNCVAEIGYGDDNHAVGFRKDANGVWVFIRSSITGSAADLTAVKFENWDNYHVLTDVDWTKSQIFVIDFQSLAVGRVRFYLDRSGELIPCHEITNDNIKVGPYWGLASLPAFWSVTNTGTAAATCRILAICATVKSEGGLSLEQLLGFPFTAKRSALLTVSTTQIPLLSIQVQTTYNTLFNHTLVLPRSVSVYSDDQGVEYQVVLNPTLTGPSWTQVHANSSVYYDVTASAMTGGRAIATNYISGAARGGVDRFSLEGRVPLSVYGGTATGDILTIGVVRTGSTNANCKGAIDYAEVR